MARPLCLWWKAFAVAGAPASARRRTPSFVAPAESGRVLTEGPYGSEGQFSLKSNTRLSVFCLVTVASAGLATAVAARAGRPAITSVWDGVYTETQAKAGQVLFTTKCVECHGEDLAGREQAPPLAGPPFIERWNKTSLKKLIETIEQMPPDSPKVLTSKQYTDILAFLLSSSEFPAGKTALPDDRLVLSDIQVLATRPDSAPR